jgi:hypothetical protein
VTEAEASEVEKRLRTALRRRRLFRWGLIALAVLGVGAWIAFENIGTTRFLPPPASSIGAVPTQGAWPMFQRDPAHTALVPDGGPVPEGELKWRFVTQGPIFSSPAVVGGRVYLSTGDRRIVALDGESGEMIWEHRVSGPVNSSPAVAGDLLFIGLRDGNLVALNKDTGDLHWQFRTGGPIHSSPAVFEGVVYVGSGDKRVYSLDAMTGAERWSYLTDGRVMSAPAVHEDVVAVTSQDRYIHIIDSGTGNRRLDYLTSSARGSPAFYENMVFAADESGAVRAIDWRSRVLPFEKAVRWMRTQIFVWGLADAPPRQKGLVWSFRAPGESFAGTPAVAGDRLYVGSRSGLLFALNRSTGEKEWTFAADQGLVASPSVVGETVFVGDEGGILYAVEATTGELRWRFEVDGPISSTPVWVGGILYVTSLDGILYVIK